MHTSTFFRHALAYLRVLTHTLKHTLRSEHLLLIELFIAIVGNFQILQRTLSLLRSLFPLHHKVPT